MSTDAATTALDIVPATATDAPELLVLTLACWVQEAIANDTLAIPALHEGLDEAAAGIAAWDTYVVRAGGRLVGSVRGRLGAGPDDDLTWEVGRLMVAPDLQGHGLGRQLIEYIQDFAPAEAQSFTLFTGLRSEANLRFYARAGFTVRPELPAPPTAVILTKPR